MPLGFWNDPDGERYRGAYFERFPGVWHHGDYAELTAHGGIIIYGRSDAVLNPGGVRIGTAEIYRQVESLPQVAESLAVGQDWHERRARRAVRAAAGRRGARGGAHQADPRHHPHPCHGRHVPAKIIAVADIPRTLSGKIIELAVRNVIHGLPVNNADALANPEALEYFRDLPELRI